MPTHQSISFGQDSRVDVVPIAAWQKLFEVEPTTQRYCVMAPIAGLRKLLKLKGLPPPNQELKMTGCPDASAAFTLHARRVRFGKGDGFLYVTEFFIEPVLTSNSGLQAVFQGLTDDGKTWVGGAFPLKAKGLRDDGGDLIHDQAAYKKALAADAAMLSKLTPKAFEPDLDSIAAAIGKVEMP
jgi:hypothetical protein